MNKIFVRNLDGSDLMEIFFVTAVASILAIRGFLHLTGYPQFSPGNLHIAHVLVGGIFMLLAMILFQAFTGRAARSLAALLGGFGFGAFIDEVGKFVTANNDYFFKPSVAIIYIIFIIIYFLMERINRSPWLSDKERLVNVLELTKEAVTQDLRSEDQQRALSLLNEADPNNPVTIALSELMKNIESIPTQGPDAWTRIKRRASNAYARIVRKPWFTRAVMALFITISLFSLLTNSLEIIIQFIPELQPAPLTLSDLGGAVSALLASAYVAAGVLRMRRDRLRAYRLFKTSILIQIFLVDIFIFLDMEFAGLIKLAIDIAVLLTLRYMIDQETMVIDSASIQPAVQQGSPP
ncbi:MAG: hypothetical protein M0Q43_05550 [Methanothrix sp.]|nr:hypothetical protein [Methanothrix sp.]